MRCFSVFFLALLFLCFGQCLSSECGAAWAQYRSSDVKVTFTEFKVENTSDLEMALVKLEFEALKPTTFFSCYRITLQLCDGLETSSLAWTQASKKSTSLVFVDMWDGLVKIPPHTRYEFRLEATVSEREATKGRTFKAMLKSHKFKPIAELDINQVLLSSDNETGFKTESKNADMVGNGVVCQHQSEVTKQNASSSAGGGFALFSTIVALVIGIGLLSWILQLIPISSYSSSSGRSGSSDSLDHMSTSALMSMRRTEVGGYEIHRGPSGMGCEQVTIDGSNYDVDEEGTGYSNDIVVRSQPYSGEGDKIIRSDGTVEDWSPWG